MVAEPILRVMIRRMQGRGAAGVSIVLVLAAVLVLVLGVVGVLVWAMSGEAGLADAGGGAATGAAGDAEAANAIEASLRASQVYLESNEVAKAEAVLTSAVGQFPEDQPLRLALAEVLLRQDRAEEAYGQFEAALAIDPSDPEVHFAAGTLASTLGRLDRAIEHYSMARSASPEEARYALFLAAVQLEAGDREEAKVNFLHALHLDPSSASAAAALAQVALDENDRELALTYAQRARSIEPDELAYLVLEARSLRRLGRAEEALTMLLALPDDRLYQPGVLSLASECLGLLRRPGDAAALYADALSVHPGEAEYAFQAALWFERAGDNAAAMAHARRAQMLGHPMAGSVVDRLGPG